MDGALGEAGEHALVAIDHRFDGIVIRQHGENGVAPARIGDAGGKFRALGDQCVSFCARAVVYGYLMPGPEQAFGHARAHLPQSDPSDLHDNFSFAGSD